MQPRAPIYIVSKGRFERPFTSRQLDRMGVPHRLIVEEQEVEDYAQTIARHKLLVLPQTYLDDYDTFWDDTDPRKGPGAARNYAWDHAIAQGAAMHWVMDDNIRHFWRLNRNERLKVRTGAIFRAAEDFVDRYENVAMSGFEYHGFTIPRQKKPPYRLNARIYSCNLIRNDMPYRWRGRYNEDTDLSLRMLKDGWVTVLFNAFLQEKSSTQTVAGGNTAEFYWEGTKKKSQMLVDMHPDLTRLVFRFHRWHHFVDYSPFQNNRLHKKADLNVPHGVNEYGMALVETEGRRERDTPRPLKTGTA